METLNKKKYRYMQISIASPEEIKSWATREINGEIFYGEVKNSETLHHRSFKPIEDGLCCEKIFGPIKDNTCSCNKTTKKGGTDLKVCPKCHVELTSSKVRRERMGYIQLETPVVHTWFFKNSPNKIAILLHEKAKDIENIIYYASYIVTEVSDDIDERIANCPELNHNQDNDNFSIKVGDILSEQLHAQYSRLLPRAYKAQTGAEAIKTLLHNLDLEKTIAELREEFKTATKQRKEQIVKRLELCEAFYHSGNKPEWMVMDVIPVIPPDLRPMVPLDGGRWTTTDLIKLYQTIINRNIQLRKEREQLSTELIMKNQKRMIQTAVDELIDFSKSNKKASKDKTKALKSLSDILRGKQGRFRQNLLGKRVDFSGRSVIVVGPDLKMYQCGIPRQMALTLFEPFIINYLINKDKEKQLANLANGLEFKQVKEKTGAKKAKEMIALGTPEAMEALEHVIVEHPVLLNRAPTLHRLSIQAFEPKLVEGKAIRLHPLVTTAFNADFDGDQMPVHVPLSQEAQAEARLLMLASKNILAPKDGKPIVTPSQDMILGNYYLTIEKPDPREGHAFKDTAEAEHAYEEGLIGMHTRFVIPASAINKDMINVYNAAGTEEFTELEKKNTELKNRYLITTIGKVFFNSIFPASMPYVNSATLENLTYGMDETYLIDKHIDYKEYIHNLPCQQPVKKKFLSMIIAEVFKQCQLAETSNTLDKMKDIGFYYSTRAGITISAFDVINVEGKQEILDKADDLVDKYRRRYERGMMLEEERYKKVVDQWTKASEELKEKIKGMMKEQALTNDIFLMADSGARGSDSNFLQLAGMRGLMAKPNGETMEIPIKSNFNEGLTMSEYFISTHGARKGSTDTALKTAESGYLTRRLVDVSQDVIITCDDCGTDKGLYVNDIYNDKAGIIETDANGVKKIVVPLYDRILGRYAAEEISYINDNGEKEVVVYKDQFISDNIAKRIIKYRDTFFKENPDQFKGVRIRTVFTCNAANLSNGEHGCPTPNGVCRKCYGSDLSTNLPVEKGEVVGVIAAQSIGEPGTQLTMRTFHSGGVAGDDITQGLPRIQELFEAREPKVKGIIAKFKGTVVDIEHDDKDNRTKIKVRGDIKIRSEKKETRVEEYEYVTDSGKKAVVKKGDHVEAGQQLSEGLIHPKELIKYASVIDVENYILKEVEKVYRSQSVDIQDKHVEIIIKQMLQKVLVVDPGYTNLLQGTYVSKPELYKAIKECYQKYHGKGLPAVRPVLLGITRSSLKSDSFLSAASFQETTRVLTEAAIHGKVDKLEGLKENIIIGGLIPAGTGLVDNVELDETISLNKYDLNN